MAIVANGGEIENLKSVNDSFKNTDELSILSSIYKLKQNNKFSVDNSKKKIKSIMTNRDQSPDIQSQNSNPNTTTSTTINLSKEINQTSLSHNVSTPNSPSNISLDTSKIITSLKAKQTKSSESNAIIGTKSNLPINPITIKTPSPVNVIQNENSNNSNESPSKKINTKQSPLINDNGLTISPPISVATKFSIANILNGDCEPLDTNQDLNCAKHNQQPIRFPSNTNSSLTPNMMLNQNDLAALSSFNLIAWQQASYAAQHAGN